MGTIFLEIQSDLWYHIWKTWLKQSPHIISISGTKNIYSWSHGSSIDKLPVVKEMQWEEERGQNSPYLLQTSRRRKSGGFAPPHLCSLLNHIAVCWDGFCGSALLCSVWYFAPEELLAMCIKCHPVTVIPYGCQGKRQTEVVCCYLHLCSNPWFPWCFSTDWANPT